MSIDEAHGCVQEAAHVAKPGANYAGQGLCLEIVGVPGTAIINMSSDNGAVCNFASNAELTGEQTRLQIGPLVAYGVLKHKVMLIPVGTEIKGYGYYKRFLSEVANQLKRADAQTAVTIGEAG